MPLTRREARALIDAAAEKAEELGMKAAFAVVDATGRLISLDQLDGALPERDRMAKAKAMATIITGQDASELADMMEERPMRYHGLLGMFPGEIYITGGGGVLLEVDGEIVGAMGISGGKHGSDDKMAEAGIAAWRAMRDEVQ